MQRGAYMQDTTVLYTDTLHKRAHSTLHYPKCTHSLHTNAQQIIHTQLTIWTYRNTLT